MAARLAARQHGVVARWQLSSLGFSVAVIDGWVKAGKLHVVHRGVYAVGHRRLSGLGHVMGAVLACGPDAVASHRDGAALWEIRRKSSRTIDVTAPGRSRHARPGIVVHRVRRLAPEDIATRDGIAVTSLARTLLDLGEVVPERDVERAFEEAERRRLLDTRAIADVLHRYRGHRGARSLAAVVRVAVGPPPLTRSELERCFLELCRRYGLPRPVVNAVICGYEVDFYWPGTDLVVELDSRAYHLNRAAFERDRARDAKLQVEGHRVLRVTDRRLMEDEAAVAGEIRALLAAGGVEVAAR
ncbi:MAG: hypothetical protein QOD53_298 [Thermoleophilaceae bacterium]|nr:hypothetical protein [Thermoleophilaceae bacterium]